MVEKRYNINPIGNWLKAQGADENAIFGCLCNIMAESGADPLVEEYGREGTGFYPPSYGWQYRHGFGLVQYSYQPLAEEAYNYSKTHTETETLYFECNQFFNDPGWNTYGTWQTTTLPTGRTYPTIASYWKNIYSCSAQQMAMDWIYAFERPNKITDRYAIWANVVNAEWDRSGNVPDNVGGIVGGGGTPEPEPEPSKNPPKKTMSLQDCMTFLDKVITRPSKPPAESPDPTTPPNPPSGGGGTSGVGDIIWNNYQLFVSHNTHYSTAGYAIRMRFTSDPWIADCSTFVMSCVNLILGGDATSFSLAPAWNTVGMISGMGGLGWHLERSGYASTLDGDIKTGDIIIMGTGSGAKAHTIIAYNDNGDCVEVTGGDGYYTYAMRDRNISWHRLYNLPYFDKNFLFRLD